MAGHNKWSKVKHKKAREDARRSKLFSKVIRALTVAAREGGDDPAMNPKLRLAISQARAVNMPKDNIANAIAKGVGASGGADYREQVYEGYGPAGVAFIVEALTDNGRRTASQLRHIFTKHGNGLGGEGCVSWQFERRGLVVLWDDGRDEDDFAELLIDAGASDFEREATEDGRLVWLAYSEVAELADFERALREAGLEILEATLTRTATQRVQVSADQLEKVLRLHDVLEDNDDVQKVYANFEVCPPGASGILAT